MGGGQDGFCMAFRADFREDGRHEEHDTLPQLKLHRSTGTLSVFYLSMFHRQLD